MKLTFADEFDTLKLQRLGDAKGWATSYDWASYTSRESHVIKDESEIYVDQTFAGSGTKALGINPFTVQNGELTIKAAATSAATKAALWNADYTSGLITTSGAFSQTYGYFEMRAKLPQGKGMWPAFWLLPADLSWPPELDVVESIGDASEVYFTAHSQLGSPPAVKVAVDPDAFHVFSVSWDPKAIVWYVDGREVKRQPTPADMSKPMYMLANLAVGGGWPGDPDDTTPWPGAYRIDYIRAYRFAP